MSKAFTRESDEPADEEIPSVRPELPPGARNYITKEGLERLRGQLDEAVKTRRVVSDGNDTDPGVVADQRKRDSVIRKLQSILDSVVLAEIPADQDKVAFGASVVVRHGNGEEEQYQIVGVDESDPSQGRISWISPLSRALLNHRVGDKVRFQSPAGVEELSIRTVQYCPRG